MKEARPAFLVALDWTRPKDPPLSLGLASIVTHCSSLGLRPRYRAWACNHFADDPTRLDLEVMQWLRDSGATNNSQAFIGFGAFVWNEQHIQTISHCLAKSGNLAKVVIGGPQVSYAERGSLESHYPYAQGFVRGHGEVPIAELMLGRTATGVHWAGSPDAGQHARASLSQLASPFLQGVVPPHPFIRWETQRGCPFRCSFCQHAEPGLASATRNQTAPDRVAAEIAWLCRHAVSDVAVLDPIFNSGSFFLHSLAGLQKERFAGKLSLQVRAEMAMQQPDFLPRVESLQRSSGAKVVLELGLQTAVKAEMQVINRPNNLRAFAAFVSAARMRGIATDVSLIYGLPKQTLDSFRRSLDFVRALQPSRVRAFPLMLLRGTELYRARAALSLREACADLKEVAAGIPVVVESPSFSRAQWEEMKTLAEALTAQCS